MKYLFVLSFFICVSCQKTTSNSDTPFNPGAFEDQGHRGTRGLMPENTIAAMYKAIDTGANNLEMDLAITADGKVIVSHDPFFDAAFATKPNGQPVITSEQFNLNMYTMTYDSISKYDVGLRGNTSYPLQKKMPAKVPLLSDLIDSVENYCNLKGVAHIPYNIEIKSSPLTDDLYYPKVPVYVDLVMKVVNAKNIGARVNVTSFDPRALIYLHQNYPAVSTSFNSNDMSTIESDIATLGFTPTCYCADYSTITPALVVIAHKYKTKVIAFTPDDVTAITTVTVNGADGIITDYPFLYK